MNITPNQRTSLRDYLRAMNAAPLRSQTDDAVVLVVTILMSQPDDAPGRLMPGSPGADPAVAAVRHDLSKLHEAWSSLSVAAADVVNGAKMIAPNVCTIDPTLVDTLRHELIRQGVKISGGA